ncbi:MAG: hypothetical protein COU27_02980 [Candidatus Levybacteria bacterium CG10_big_fil_rev_8_21_14_0_10_36_7]|nr:MAG: hypothetical protein COU27_02980 [Candidatus Levybacteria bacterium CG10_big_fil_rev_8_21_14_0_10_36_7]
MIKKIKNLLFDSDFVAPVTILVMTAILILGFFLRSNDLYTWPRQGATFDEYAWTWQGINLIQKGVPESWSPHAVYTNVQYVTYQQTNFRLVKPYLEHPPVFGLVTGSFALLNGVKDMYSLSLESIRPLALLLGLFSVVMVYLLVKELYDKKTAFLSSLLFATIPTIVIGSRIVQNENFIIPFWLLALFFIFKYLKSGRARFRNMAAVICGFLALSKVPWIAAGFSIFLIFLFLKKYIDAVKFLGILVPIFLLFFVYGFYYDGGLFLSLWGLQLNRYDIGFTSIYSLFQKPYLVDRFYLDGWIYFGWFAFALLLKDVKKNLLIVLPILSYFLIFLAAIPDEPGHGWYRYPFYPFLIISIALFIRNYFSKNLILTFFFLVLVGTTLFQNTWGQVFGFSYILFRVLIIAWGFSLAPLFFSFRGVSKWTNFLNWGWIIIFVLLNIWSVMLYNEQ